MQRRTTRSSNIENFVPSGPTAQRSETPMKRRKKVIKPEDIENFIPKPRPTVQRSETPIERRKSVIQPGDIGNFVPELSGPTERGSENSMERRESLKRPHAENTQKFVPPKRALSPKPPPYEKGEGRKLEDDNAEHVNEDHSDEDHVGKNRVDEPLPPYHALI